MKDEEQNVTELRVLVSNRSGRIVSTETKHPETGELVPVKVDWEPLLGLEKGTIRSLFEEVEAARRQAPQPPQGQPMVLILGGQVQAPAAPAPSAVGVRTHQDPAYPPVTGIRTPGVAPSAPRTAPPEAPPEADLPWLHREEPQAPPWLHPAPGARPTVPWEAPADHAGDAAVGIRLGEAPGVLDDSGSETD
ncbi:MAG: hypothetical protein MI919_28070 [Holophagales bacterium]|nr:hypothetical protein [Holophagales bacterium]